MEQVESVGVFPLYWMISPGYAVAHTDVNARLGMSTMEMSLIATGMRKRDNRINSIK